MGRAVEKTSSDLLIDSLIANPKITIKELQKTLGLSRRGVEWNINKLKGENKIERVGPDKGGYWKVINPKEDRQL